MANILLVEDESDLARLVKDWLARDQHNVDIIPDGDQALAHLRVNKATYNLLILDILLPGKSGFEICKHFRTSSGVAPVLMLTAKDSIDDKEIGFKLGADDYICKPFHLKELSARVSALLRRGTLIPDNKLTLRDIVLDCTTRCVTKAGKEVHLSPKEFHLLEFLIRHPNQVFSAEDIIEQVWEPDSDAMNDTVRGHINRLRRKLDTKGETSIISNVYGFGYKLEPQPQ